MRVINLRSHLVQRKLVYLDTNAWSDFAKGAIDPRPLDSWLQRGNFLLWFSRFQIAELSRSDAAVERLASLLTKLDPLLLDLHHYDLSGGHWIDAIMLPLASTRWMASLPDAFKTEFMQSEGMARARADLLAHGAEMADFVAVAQGNMRQEGWPTWREFPERNAKWVAARTYGQKSEVNPLFCALSPTETDRTVVSSLWTFAGPTQATLWRCCHADKRISESPCSRIGVIFVWCGLQRISRPRGVRRPHRRCDRHHQYRHGRF